MNPFQLMQMMQSTNNPMGMFQQLMGNNPIMQRAMQMGQGKNPEQLQSIVRNLAQQRGMNEEQLNQFIGQFGMKL